MRAALAAGCVMLALACRPSATSVEIQIEPRTPRAGAPTSARLTIHRGGTPVTGAAVTVEAHMAHPGMAPVVAIAADRGNGVYEAQLQLTMAGDWTFVGVARLPDGSRRTHELTVSGVQPANPTH